MSSKARLPSTLLAADVILWTRRLPDRLIPFLLLTKQPDATKQPEGCQMTGKTHRTGSKLWLAPTSLLGVLPAMRLTPKLSAPSRSLGSLLATGRPPTHSTPPWMLGLSLQIFVLLAPRRPPGTRGFLGYSTYFWRFRSLSEPNPGHGAFWLPGAISPSPPPPVWLVSAFLIVCAILDASHHFYCLSPS